jgi:hypothetical protein
MVVRVRYEEKAALRHRGTTRPVKLARATTGPAMTRHEFAARQKPGDAMVAILTENERAVGREAQVIRELEPAGFGAGAPDHAFELSIGREALDPVVGGVADINGAG